MKNYIVRMCFMLAPVLALPACTEGFEEMNTDPNRVTAVPYNTLITNAMNSAARAYYQHKFTDSWVRYEVRNVYTENDNYETLGANTNFNAFNGHLKDFKQALMLADEAGDVNSEAVAKIMLAYSFQNETDRFGDIPYTEALSADGNPSIFFPVYDRQKDIYDDLIKQLKEANSMIDPMAFNPGDADIMFKGDMMQWKRFCNSLLLRIYMRISLVDPGTARDGIEEICSNSSIYPVISSNDENAFIGWIAGDPNYRNRRWLDPELVSVAAHNCSEAMADFLNNRNDDRRMVYLEPAANSDLYAGLPLGTIGEVTNDYSLLNLIHHRGEESPARLFKYSEVLFIKAEAALNGWSVGITAQEAYEAAIQASFEEYELTMPASYLTDPLVDFNGAALQRELIGDQKWCALFPDGTQGWAEMRRTHFPTYVKITEPANNIYPGLGTPVRIPYPDTEFLDNPMNYADAIEAQPGIVQEKFGAGVWWDVK